MSAGEPAAPPELPRVDGIDLPELDPEHRLQRILKAAHRAHGGHDGPARGEGATAPWAASFYDLDRSRLFQGLDEDRRQRALSLCAQGLLEEAYFVEKAGVGYAARMVLEARTTQERQLYGVIAGEEAVHLGEVARFFPGGAPVGTEDPFLRLLGDVIEHGTRAVRLLLAQVVLEGWGLQHYRRMAEGCRDDALREVLQSILRDEARHHGCGVVLFEEAEVTAADRAAMTDALADLLQMVRVGPQRVVTAVAEAAGHLSRAEKIELLTELDTEVHSAARLKTLQGLLRAEAIQPVVQALDERGCFEPLPPEACA